VVGSRHAQRGPRTRQPVGAVTRRGTTARRGSTSGGWSRQSGPMITPRAATALRHRLVEVASSHGGLTSVVIGVLTWTWAKLAPVRAHVATWVDATVERLPD